VVISLLRMLAGIVKGMVQYFYWGRRMRISIERRRAVVPVWPVLQTRSRRGTTLAGVRVHMIGAILFSRPEWPSCA
jgi:hypothetical protein